MDADAKRQPVPVRLERPIPSSPPYEHPEIEIDSALKTHVSLSKNVYCFYFSLQRREF